MKDLYELYALGLLEEPERSQVETELASGSEEARARMRQALENNAILLAMAPEVEPAASLRDRVLQVAGGVEPGRANSQWMWAWMAASAALLVTAFWLSSSLSNRSSELATVRDQLRRVSSDAADSHAQLLRARAMLAFLNAPETRIVTFGPRDPKPPKGKVLVHPGRGVLLVASNLPPATRGQIYEMWVIVGGKASPAGLFQSDADGNALHLFENQVAPGAAVAVTLEPEAGSAQPTTTPLFVATI